MSQDDSHQSQFPALEQARPLLEERATQHRDELCIQMLEIIDRLQALEHDLQSDAEIQERFDARLNATNCREAAYALVEADSTLALAARKLSFHA